MPERDAIDEVLRLRTGERFKLHGRTFTINGMGGVTHAERFSIFPVWNEKHRETRVKVKPTDRVEILGSLR